MASLGSLVIELAANTARLQSDMGKAVGIIQRGAGVMKNAIASISGGVLAGGIVAVAGRAIEFGDSLNKAAIKAGLGARAISELAYAAKQSDIDLTSLSTALKKMQVSLSEAAAGGKAQIKTLDELGISVAQIRALKPDQQFELIADRISEILDPADRARFATELFGKAGADLLPMFEQGAAGIRKAREEAQKLGASFSDEQLRRLAQADDATKRLTASWEAFATVLTAKVAPSLANVLDSLSGDTSRFVRQRSDTDLKAYVGRLRDSQKAGTLTGGEERSLQEAEKELERRFSARVKSRGTRFGAGTLPTKAQENAAPEKTGKPIPPEWIERQKQMTEALSEWIEAKVEDINLTAKYIDAVGDEEDAMRTLSEIANESGEQASKTIENTYESMTEFARQAARNMQDALALFLFDPFKDGLKGMLRGFVDTLRKMVAEAAAAKIFKGLSGIGSGNSSGILKSIGAFFGGFKAQGGPLNPGKWYVAGEHGPEPIWGGGAGAFASGYGGGGGSVVAPVFNIDARGAQEGVAAQIQRAIAQAAPMIVDASRRQIKDDLSRRAIR